MRYAARMLRAEGLRLEAGDHEVFRGSFELGGPHVLVLGAPAELFQAAVGERAPTAGTLRWSSPVVHAGQPRALPPRWTAREWIAWRLRLAGLGKKEAAARAAQTLEGFGLQAFAKTRLDRARAALVRALPLLAAAAQPAPSDAVLCFDDAFAGLDDDSAAHLAARWVEQLGERPWVGFLPRLSPRSPLVQATHEVLVVARGQVALQGPPAQVLADDPLYVVRVQGTRTQWPERMAELGFTLLHERQWPATDSDGKELIVRLTEGQSPRDLFGVLEPQGDADVIVELFAQGGHYAAR